MSDKTFNLSASGRAVLTLAATRKDRLVPPPKLPAAAARQVVRSLISNGLLEDIAATTDDPALLWRTGDDGMQMVLRATGAGIDAVSEGAGTGDAQAPNDWSNRIEPAPPALLALVERFEADKQAYQQPSHGTRIGATEPAQQRIGLRQAAESVLAAWEALAAPGSPRLCWRPCRRCARP